MTTADVVVIGGGIAGLSAAWSLADESKVVLVEQESQLASHATGRSAAVITETYGPPAVCALATASRPFLTNPPAGFTPTPLLKSRGMLWVHDKPQSLGAVAALAHQLGASHTPLSPDEACQLVPTLRPDWVGDALLESSAMSIDVAALVDGYRAGLLARGGTICTTHQVTAVQRLDGRWRIEKGGEAITCEVIVNAAGAWADQVAQIAGLAPLGLQPFRRSAFVFPCNDPGVGEWPLVMDFGGRFYFEPEGNGLLASPAEETPCDPHDARADELAMAQAVDALALATTLQVRGVRGRWAGLRTFAPDRHPIVGFDPRAPGLFWLAGQGGAGIKTAPALAAMTRALVTGDHGALPLGVAQEDFAPDRLLL